MPPASASSRPNRYVSRREIAAIVAALLGPGRFMLIVSKFHDYYDTITAYGIDKTVVYNRALKQRALTKIEDELLPIYFGRWSGRGEAHLRIIGFCGELYPVVYVQGKKRKVFCYTAKSAIETMEEEIKEVPDQKVWGSLLRLDSKLGIRACFDMAPYAGFKKIFQEEKAPVFIIGNKLSKKNESLIVNPCLKAWGFEHMVPPIEAFQKIYQFISGVLGTPAPETVTIDDKHKAIAHGHDDPYSFRKPPGGGQWR